MTSQALEVVHAQPPAALLPTSVELQLMGSIARMAVEAAGHSIPAHLNTPGKVMAVLLSGFEAGLRPMTALRHRHIVNGRVEFSAQALAGIVMAKEPGITFEVVSRSPVTAAVRFRRPSRGVDATYEHTLEMAKTAGLLRKDGPWHTYPADMLVWACVKRLVRLYASDLANNIGGGGVGAASALLDAAPAAPVGAVLAITDVHDEQLYSPGDRPDEPVVELGNGALADGETGEVLGAAPAEVDQSGAIESNRSTSATEPVTEAAAASEAAGGDLRLGRWPTLGAFLMDVWDDWALSSTDALKVLGLPPAGGPSQLLEVEGGLDAAYIALAQSRQAGAGVRA